MREIIPKYMQLTHWYDSKHFVDTDWPGIPLSLKDRIHNMIIADYNTTYEMDGQDDNVVYCTNNDTLEKAYILKYKYRIVDDKTMIRRDLLMREITPKILHISKHYWNEHIEYGYYCEDGVLEKLYDNVMWNYNTQEEVCIDLKKYRVVFENLYSVVLEYGMSEK